MRLVCDYYVIQGTSQEQSPPLTDINRYPSAKTAISAKSAQSYPKKLDIKFALFAVCAHAFHKFDES